MKQFGGTRVLIHYGGRQRCSAPACWTAIKAALDEAGIAHVELGGVVPNPHLAKAREGIALCKAERRGLPAGCGRRFGHRLLQGHRLRPG